jgi:hypothetical protein
MVSLQVVNEVPFGSLVALFGLTLDLVPNSVNTEYSSSLKNENLKSLEKKT